MLPLPQADADFALSIVNKSQWFRLDEGTLHCPCIHVEAATRPNIAKAFQRRANGDLLLWHREVECYLPIIFDESLNILRVYLVWCERRLSTTAVSARQTNVRSRRDRTGYRCRGMMNSTPCRTW